MKVKVYHYGIVETVMDVSDKYRVIVEGDPLFNETVALGDGYWDLQEEIEQEARAKLLENNFSAHIVRISTMDESQALFEE